MFLFIPCPITFNILIHEYFIHVKKKKFQMTFQQKFHLLCLFLRLILCHVWVSLRGCLSQQTIYHSLMMYRYLLHTIHLCMIGYVHFTTRCAESKTMLKKATEFFTCQGFYYIYSYRQSSVSCVLTLLTFNSTLYLYLDYKLLSSLPKYTQCPNTFRFAWKPRKSNRH